ncbi:hypothetical protein [Undibacterium sp. YM2]|uniref:hypothetical protein n=1 Tax=Undibacterium sp. YM2 TaxID=2058625 RepID=UPI00138A5382|nr:hypothetical protein [Undibacterium sp. YM2]
MTIALNAWTGTFVLLNAASTVVGKLACAKAKAGSKGKTDKRQAGAKRIDTVVVTLSHIVEQARKGNRKAFFLCNEILSAPHIFWLFARLDLHCKRQKSGFNIDVNPRKQLC